MFENFTVTSSTFGDKFSLLNLTSTSTAEALDIRGLTVNGQTTLLDASIFSILGNVNNDLTIDVVTVEDMVLNNAFDR